MSQIDFWKFPQPDPHCKLKIVLIGQEEQEVVRHLFQRLGLVLMRGNAQLLVNRMPPEDLPEAEVDGYL